jgi:hypothetical protein
VSVFSASRMSFFLAGSEEGVFIMLDCGLCLARNFSL